MSNEKQTNKQAQESKLQTLAQASSPAAWPFPVVNAQRTPESLALMAKKHVKSKPDDCSDMEEATW